MKILHISYQLPPFPPHFLSVFSPLRDSTFFSLRDSTFFSTIFFVLFSRAVKLMGGLGSEKIRWTESCTSLIDSYENLVGDSLVSAGTIGERGRMRMCVCVCVN